MTLFEAEKFAEERLFKYREDMGRLEQKRFKLQSLCGIKGLQYGDESGRASAKYVDSVPWWLEEQEKLECWIRELELVTLPIERMICDIEKSGSELIYPWKLRFEPCYSMEHAIYLARHQCQIGAKRFRTLCRVLIEKAIIYLDLSIGGGKRIGKG